MNGHTHGGAGRWLFHANDSAFVSNGRRFADTHNDIDFALQLRLHLTVEEDSTLTDIANQTRVMLTGYADPQIAAEAVNRAEVFRLLWKPWSDAEVVAIVRQAAWKAALSRDDRIEPPQDPFAMSMTRN